MGALASYRLEATASIAKDFVCPLKAGGGKTKTTYHGAYLELIFFSLLYFPASGQAAVTGVVPSPPRFLPSIFIAHRVQQSHCWSIFHRVLLTPALPLSGSQFVHKIPTN